MTDKKRRASEVVVHRADPKVEGWTLCGRPHGAGSVDGPGGAEALIAGEHLDSHERLCIRCERRDRGAKTA